jgi:hypothetical protein
MNIETIDMPIRVLADCSNGAVTPLRLLWNERAYRVDRVNGRWSDQSGDGPVLHFSVQVGDETFMIHFALLDVQWWLDQIVLQG